MNETVEQLIAKLESELEERQSLRIERNPDYKGWVATIGYSWYPDTDMRTDAWAVGDTLAEALATLYPLDRMQK